MGYLSPGCRVYDLIDEDCADEEAMEVDEGKKKGYCNLIVDVTKTWKVSDKFKEPTKNQEQPFAQEASAQQELQITQSQAIDAEENKEKVEEIVK